MQSIGQLTQKLSVYCLGFVRCSSLSSDNVGFLINYLNLKSF